MNNYAIFRMNGEFVTMHAQGANHADALIRLAEHEQHDIEPLITAGNEYIVIGTQGPFAQPLRNAEGLRVLRLERVEQPQFRVIPR